MVAYWMYSQELNMKVYLDETSPSLKRMNIPVVCYYMNQTNDNSELLNAWNEAAKELDVDPMREVRYGKCFRYIKEINRDCRILEVGCGEGTGLLIAKSLGFTNIQGVEVSKERLKKARSKLGEAASIYLTTPDNKFPFPDEAFDVVISAAVIEHTKDPKGFIGELSRLVRPDGGLIIISSDCYQWKILQLLGVYQSIQPIDKAIFPSHLMKYFKEFNLNLIHYEGFPLPKQEYRFFRMIFKHLFSTISVIVPRQLKNLVNINFLHSIKYNESNQSCSTNKPTNTENSFISTFDQPWQKQQNTILSLVRLIFSDENVFFLRR